MLLAFARHTLRAFVRGSRGYYAWLGFLFACIVAGSLAYREQLLKGLIVTNMTNQVSWGAYIANFTFLVGVAAAAVLLVIPAYLYRDHAMRSVVVFGEQLAFAVMVMVLLFVTVDLGRPDRFWHMLPVIGRFNWPLSLLTWDVIALGGYLLLNGYLTLYLVYTKFSGRAPERGKYKPFVYIAIAWAIAIHTVTAFLYSGLGGRPHWHAAILAPRFIASAFASGPAIMIVAFALIQRQTRFTVPDSVFTRLRQIGAVAMIINLFMFGSEIFTELYPGTVHASAMRYHLFGLHGHNALVPFAWTALALNAFATVVFVTRALYQRLGVLLVASCAAVTGVWIEKGMTFLMAGLVPTPLGDVVDYRPSHIELLVSLGIWAIGALLFTFMLKATIPIEAREAAT